MGAACRRGAWGAAFGIATGLTLGGCALAVDWSALRRGQPDPDAGVPADAGPSARDDAAFASDTWRSGPSDVGPDRGVDTGAVDVSALDAKSSGDADSAAAPSNDAGCLPDPSVSCGDPSQLGVSCAAGAQPSQMEALLPCGSAVSTVSGESSFCCSGNYCNFQGLPEDTNDCKGCYDQNCGALFCGCASDTAANDTDGDGVPLCLNYENCIAECDAPTAADCEDECDPETDGNAYALQEGRAMDACVETYCSQSCD